jgi:hypothetical protein
MAYVGCTWMYCGASCKAHGTAPHVWHVEGTDLPFVKRGQMSQIQCFLSKEAKTWMKDRIQPHFGWLWTLGNVTQLPTIRFSRIQFGTTHEKIVQLGPMGPKSSSSSWKQSNLEAVLPRIHRAKAGLWYRSIVGGYGNMAHMGWFHSCKISICWLIIWEGSNYHFF